MILLYLLISIFIIWNIYGFIMAISIAGSLGLGEQVKMIPNENAWKSGKTILLVTEFYPPNVKGGGELSAEQLAVALVNAGNDVTVLTSFTKKAQVTEFYGHYRIIRMLETIEAKNVILQALRFYKLNKSVKHYVRKLHKENKYDIIHCYNNTTMDGVVMAGTDAKLVTTINNYTYLCPKSNMLFRDKDVCDGCVTFAKFKACMKSSEVMGNMKIPAFIKGNDFLLKLMHTYFRRKQKVVREFNILCRSEFVKELVIMNNLAYKKIGIEYPIMEAM